MRKYHTLLAVCLTLLLTSLLCLGLYRWDNKYARQEIQPIGGLLFYAPDTDVCWLIREWMLYPDVLLTPEDIYDYSGYRTYGDIGGETDGEWERMTYRLTLILPETVREYAMELPEVFSACRMYVNDRMVLELGDPSAETYREGIQSRVVTFSASGVTDILIASADHSGVRRGMTYPPAFGTPETVFAVREGRLLLHGGFVLLAVLGAGISLLFHLKGHWKRSLLSALLCLCTAVVSGYPLLHGWFVTGVQPWYTIEPAGYYGLLLLSLLLYGSICGLGRKRQLLIAVPCILGFLLTVFRFGAASVLPDAAAGLFSVVSAGVKFYTAGCLAALSIYGIRREQCRSGFLLCGAVSLAVCLLLDRFLPIYEPIYGGWFGEIGGILLVAVLMAVLWMDAAEAYRLRMQYESSVLRLEQRLAIQKEHYVQLAAQVRLAREAGHDLRHHLRILHRYAAEEDWKRLTDYLNDYESHIRERGIQRYSEHPAADAILGYYAAAAGRLNAVYDVRFTVPPDLSIPDDELCILLGNLLENAVEAMEAQVYGERRLYLRGDVHERKLRLVLDNTFGGTIREKDGAFLSTKRPGYGLGISSINTIAEKYGGMTAFEVSGNQFHASILIPLFGGKEK